MEKKFFLIAGIMVIIFLSGCSEVPQNQISQKPEIEIIPKNYDFRNVPNEKIEHIFSVKNTGTGVLEITGISTSCGCTKGTIDKKLINSGETANLLVTIDTDLMKEKAEGKIERIVYVKSNDTDNPEIEIELTANIMG